MLPARSVTALQAGNLSGGNKKCPEGLEKEFF
jgi:hypothetical protein